MYSSSMLNRFSDKKKTTSPRVPLGLITLGVFDRRPSNQKILRMVIGGTGTRDYVLKTIVLY